MNELFPCVWQTRAANAPAFEDPAVLVFCGCRMHLPQGNTLLTSLLLLFQQSCKKPCHKYYDVRRNLSSSTRLPPAFAGHMGRQLHAVAGSGSATACGNHFLRLPFHVYGSACGCRTLFSRLDDCTFHVSNKRVRQTQVRFKIQQCWIPVVAACVCRKEIP